MPLKPPDLDDRTYKQIAEEAKKLIPRYAPEWTDWNEHDPGITLIELFAWMTELIIYRLNCVPDKSFLAFLKLVGIELEPAAPARADLTFTLTEGAESAVIPKGTQAGLEDSGDEDPILFETDEALTALGIELEAIQSYDGSSYELVTESNETDAKPYYAFGSKAPSGSALCLGFKSAAGFPDKELKLTIDLYLDDLVAEGRHCEMKESLIQPPAEAAWEAWNGTGWAKLEVTKDGTRSFMKSGSVYIDAPSTIAKTKIGEYQTEALYWIRARVVQPGFEVPPRLNAVLLNTVSATAAVTRKGEILGASDGTPDQTMTLANSPVIAGSLVLQVDEGSSDGSATNWKTWTEVADFSASTRQDAHYTLDRLTGEVAFGDGLRGRIPLPLSGGSKNVMALSYRSGGGLRSNVGKKKITVLQTSVPSVDSVTNLNAASGGRDEETVAEARKRGPQVLKTGRRAVTAEDFEFLAKETPGVRIRRAKALPLFHPDFPCREIPGVITVIVVPESKESRPMPSEGTIKTVCRHLNQHRLLTSEVYVSAPRYVEIKVASKVTVTPDSDSSAVVKAIQKEIDTFFHPLYGGDDGEGWPFGGDIYASDVYKIILKTEGVERVDSMDIYKEGRKQEATSAIDIPGHSLLYTGRHEISARYER